MRVALNAFFWDQPITGSGQYTRALATALMRLQVDLGLISSLGMVESPTCWGYPGSHPNKLGTPALAKVWFEQVTFPRAAKAFGADVAHVPYFAPPLRPSVPTVVTIHDLIPLVLPTYRGSPRVRLYTRLVSAAAARATAILADSECSKRDIVRHLGILAERVHVVYLAADGHFRPVTDAHQIEHVRRKYGLPDRYLLYLGGFDVRKNVKMLLRVYALLREATSLFLPPLVIAGRLPERDTTFAPDPRRLAQEAGLDASAVRFTGRVDEDDKPGLYTAADVFIFPSLYEGFGLPPLEAMACGTPVIAAHASSLPEVVGNAALLVAPDDPQSIANALHRTLVDPDLRADLRQHGIQRAAEFSWEKTAQQTLAIFYNTSIGRKDHARLN